MVVSIPPRGIYAPVVAFFNEDESIDFEALKTHLTRLAEGGCAGFVIQGSNGEAVHLLHSERQEILKLASKVLKERGRKDAVIIAGCGAQSTRETIQLCEEAKESGAEFALVLSPSYWTGAMTKPNIKTFFSDVATASPIPILLYNFPQVTQGIDLDSDTIADLAAANPNIVGCKLTCSIVAKLHRVAHDERITAPFATFGGKSDFFLHALVAGSHGSIAATANLFPKVHVKLIELYDAGKLKEAQDIQTKLSNVDWALVQLGVAGLKEAVCRYYGYGTGRSRRPLTSVDVKKFEGKTDVMLKELVDLEADL